jgi:hypothetical protein
LNLCRKRKVGKQKGPAQNYRSCGVFHKFRHAFLTEGGYVETPNAKCCEARFSLDFGLT